MTCERCHARWMSREGTRLRRGGELGKRGGRLLCYKLYRYVIGDQSHVMISYTSQYGTAIMASHWLPAAPSRIGLRAPGPAPRPPGRGTVRSDRTIIEPYTRGHWGRAAHSVAPGGD
eukprot:753172-Hanusia_phi.AAC.3